MLYFSAAVKNYGLVGEIIICDIKTVRNILQALLPFIVQQIWFSFGLLKSLYKYSLSLVL